ncbi:SapC family protein [Zavarzinia compransoris]|uniref:SapC family protein n=1 Tax=Zavarzinia compransoris TaxID=1264899 RepID=A0A317DS81_9PROT|nr:SapC family protein [Zavarzinia compransoris]PWR17529.1 SapC family protein [Zavarzinia compransoris]TDP40358.1 SapC protein [Zavarzinia compransoris]
MTAPAPALPLFYSAPEILDPARHPTLGVKPLENFNFARASNSLPITGLEFFELGPHYPIVFVPGAQAAPVIVVGLGGDTNLFIEDNGTWTAGKPVPAYLRRYPFILFEPEGAEQLPLCIDRAADLVAEGEGQPLFENGLPTEAAKRALQFCEAYQQQLLGTRALSAALLAADLLVERTISIGTPGGGRHDMNGFLVVDEEKFNALPDETILEWRKNGFLAAVYAHLLSQRHWLSLAARYDAVANPADRKISG